MPSTNDEETPNNTPNEPVWVKEARKDESFRNLWDSFNGELKDRWIALSREGMMLSIMIVSLARMSRLWTAIAGHPYVNLRFPGDEEVYQSLRLNLTEFPKSSRKLARLRTYFEELPEALPTSTELQILDTCIQSEYDSMFQRARTHILQTAAAIGQRPDPTLFEPLMQQFDEIIIPLEKDANAYRAKAMKRMGLDRPAQSDSAPSPATTQVTKRTGRKRIEIPYETLRRLWYVANENARASVGKHGRVPQVTHRILADLYEEFANRPISAETIRNRIRELQDKDGCPWPPTTLSDDEIASLDDQYSSLLA